MIYCLINQIFDLLSDKPNIVMNKTSEKSAVTDNKGTYTFLFDKLTISSWTKYIEILDHVKLVIAVEEMGELNVCGSFFCLWFLHGGVSGFTDIFFQKVCFSFL